MADDQHLKWLLKENSFWNLRRKNKPFRPDLTEADLRSRTFINEDLTNANLIGAKLNGSTFLNCNFEGAELSAADISGAHLRSCNLTDAKLVCADLSGAYLFDVVLDRADLFKTKLFGTVLNNVKLWKAALYAESDSPKQYPNETPVVEDIGSLLEKIRNIKKSYENYEEEVLLYFRGEPNCGWPLAPSVMRDDFGQFESEMLLEVVSRRPEEFNGIPFAFAQLVLAQHHELRTRLLDISKNPLVALFNACGGHKDDANTFKDKPGRIHIFAVPRSMVKPFNSDTISVLANFAKLSQCEQDLLLGKIDQEKEGDRTPSFTETMNRLYQFVRQEKPYFKDRLDYRDLYRVFVVEPQQSPERLRAQSGAVLVSAFHERFERDEICRLNKGTPIYAHYRLSISAKRKRPILDDLKLLNITQETLFPGLDSTTQAISSKYWDRLKNVHKGEELKPTS